MCKPISALVKYVNGSIDVLTCDSDSHEEIYAFFGLRQDELSDRSIVRIEYSPNGSPDILDHYVLRLDELSAPWWWSDNRDRVTAAMRARVSAMFREDAVCANRRLWICELMVGADGWPSRETVADYQAKRAALYADYQPKRDALDADYQPKYDALYADCQPKRDALDADYQAKYDALYADCQAKRDALDADYQAKRDALYADYQPKRDALDADYQAKYDALYADCQAKYDALYADCQPKCDALAREILPLGLITY